ncbi:hypothetical protein [Pelagibacterium lacus]|uniref:hypothetical protein n=1 Tax=Pelagibacterium lacus TaxID=2282655 RepID=UPI0011C074EE|nr:hypothetical protein [Pelagibacterium lacus]
MRLQQVKISPKTAIKIGAWSDEKLKAKDFPLSRKSGGRYPLTRRYRWQVITFECHSRSFRVLCAYHQQIPEFFAVLAEQSDGDCKVILRVEWHQSHPGWHIHSVCGHFEDTVSGISSPKQMKRIPDSKSGHRRKTFLNTGHVMGDNVATALACEALGIQYDKELYVYGALSW